MVYRGEGTEEFSVADVTPQAKAYSRTVNDNIWRLGKVKVQKEEVEMQTGEQCEQPYRCWYWDYCHAGGKEIAFTAEQKQFNCKKRRFRI